MKRRASAKFRHRITIERPPDASSVSASGARTGQWPVVWPSLPASVHPTGGGERWQKFAIAPTTTHVVEIRYAPGITADMRVRFGERLLHLERPPLDADEIGQELVLLCRERTVI